MSNPFRNSAPLPSLSHQARREKLKVGLYAGIATATVLLSGILIQGCNRPPVVSDAAPEDSAGVPLVSNNNANSTNAAPAKKPDLMQAATNQPKALPPAPVPVVVAPVPAAAPGSSSSVYVVRKGDTLIRIARNHGITLKALKAANGLERDRIVAGQRLKLPSANAGPAGPT